MWQLSQVLLRRFRQLQSAIMTLLPKTYTNSLMAVMQTLNSNRLRSTQLCQGRTILWWTSKLVQLSLNIWFHHLLINKTKLNNSTTFRLFYLRVTNTHRHKSHRSNLISHTNFLHKLKVVFQAHNRYLNSNPNYHPVVILPHSNYLKSILLRNNNQRAIKIHNNYLLVILTHNNSLKTKHKTCHNSITRAHNLKGLKQPPHTDNLSH